MISRPDCRLITRSFDSCMAVLRLVLMGRFVAVFSRRLGVRDSGHGFAVCHTVRLETGSVGAVINTRFSADGWCRYRLSYCFAGKRPSRGVAIGHRSVSSTSKAVVEPGKRGHGSSALAVVKPFPRDRPKGEMNPTLQVSGLSARAVCCSKTQSESGGLAR